MGVPLAAAGMSDVPACSRPVDVPERPVKQEYLSALRLETDRFTLMETDRYLILR